MKSNVSLLELMLMLAIIIAASLHPISSIILGFYIAKGLKTTEIKANLASKNAKKNEEIAIKMLYAFWWPHKCFKK